MNFVISIINPDEIKTLGEICRNLDIPLAVDFIGKGTAVRSMLELLGIDSSDKRIVAAVATQEKTKQLIREEKKNLYIGVPGHGIIVAVPVKSVGGGKIMALLNDGQQPDGGQPDINYAYELIVSICNSGRTDTVMNAAREAGAAGGTVIHGKGTGSVGAEKFYRVSIAQEKEVILIVSKAEQKADIMKAILKKAGPNTEAAAIVFSLPVTEVAGFGMFDEN